MCTSKLSSVPEIKQSCQLIPPYRQSHKESSSWYPGNSGTRKPLKNAVEGWKGWLKIVTAIAITIVGVLTLLRIGYSGKKKLARVRGISNFPKSHPLTIIKRSNDDADVDRQRFTTRDVGYRLTVIHTNDFHSHFDAFNGQGGECSPRDREQERCYGGIARHKTIIDEVRADKGNDRRVLLMDAGDQLFGTLFYKVHCGRINAEYMNKFGYEVTTIGNHEWDDGPPNLYENYVSRLNFPIVSANVTVQNYPELSNAFQPSVILPGNIGVVGALYPHVLWEQDPEKPVSLSDPVKAVQQQVNSLQAQGVNKIIFLSHIGIHLDRELIRQTRGIDFVVGGHVHDLLINDEGNPERKGPYPEWEENLDGRRVPIVVSHWSGKYIGVVDVDFNSDGEVTSFEGDSVMVTSDKEEDPETVALLDEWRKPIDDLKMTVVAEAENAWTRTECWDTECDLGNLIADAYSDRTGHPAILSSRSLRADLPEGNVTVYAIMAVLPFDGTLVTVDLSGGDILDTIMGGVLKENVRTGEKVRSAALFSRMRFKINKKERTFLKAEILKDGKWEDIVEDAQYEVTTTSFVANGGDHLLAKTWEDISGTIDDKEVVINYFKKLGKISTPTAGRLVFLDS